uniref:Uncharacterized protein n=1 Tax=Panagrolaimus davidi TaxID=227884 RepID=A0A914PHE1_9BILA
MCIPEYPIYDPNNICHTYQFAYSSDKLESSVTFDGKTAVVEYQVYAYPYGYSTDESEGKNFAVVIQLLNNPLNLKLKASYKFWFWDKFGEKHTFEDVTTFNNNRTVSNDICFMPSTVFQGPSLKKLPCIRLSPEFWYNGIKWQCRLFKKDDDNLWIDLQIIQNPMLKHFVANFQIYEKYGQNPGLKPKKVPHKFCPDSFCSDAVLIKSLRNFPEKSEVEIRLTLKLFKDFPLSPSLFQLS